MGKIVIFDSTLRDGAQAQGIAFTVADKLQIVSELDRLGVDYIEAGNPGSNPKDMEFFARMKQTPLTHAKLVAFGATRRKDVPASEDAGLRALLESGTEVVSVFGKADILQVGEVLETSKEENLRMISDTIDYLVKNGRQVIFDAEHFFDGYRRDAHYALACIGAAQAAGACTVVLCDTNGGTFPEDVGEIVRSVVQFSDVPVGIHCHNDMGCAVANSLAAVSAGCTHVQGTLLGFGERCGNTNLSTLIPTLELKRGWECIGKENLKRLTKSARLVADLCNCGLDASLPYVGGSAFSHKGGMHVDGVSKYHASFEHISPETVGNTRHILVSEMAGRTAMLSIIHEVDPTITKDSKEAKELTDLLKERESRGYVFESAPASLELLIRKQLGRFQPFFELHRFKVIGEQESGGNGISSAMINIRVGAENEVTAAEGEGPVHALDIALRKAVMRFYPIVGDLRLIDYKVRVLEENTATAALVRVLITTTDGEDIWTTVGVSRDIIEASLEALMDALEYRLQRDV